MCQALSDSPLEQLTCCVSCGGLDWGWGGGQVEEAVMLAMAQHRSPALLKVQSAPAADGPRMVESMG